MNVNRNNGEEEMKIISQDLDEVSKWILNGLAPWSIIRLIMKKNNGEEIMEKKIVQDWVIVGSLSGHLVMDVA